MGDMKISLPDTATEWIEARVREGGYADAGSYLRGLIERDRVRQASELTLDDLRRHVATSRASGAGQRSLDELFETAERLSGGGRPGE